MVVVITVMSIPHQYYSVRLNTGKDVTKTILPIRSSFLLKAILVAFRK